MVLAPAVLEALNFTMTNALAFMKKMLTGCRGGQPNVDAWDTTHRQSVLNGSMSPADWVTKMVDDVERSADVGLTNCGMTSAERTKWIASTVDQMKAAMATPVTVTAAATQTAETNDAIIAATKARVDPSVVTAEEVAAAKRWQEQQAAAKQVSQQQQYVPMVPAFTPAGSDDQTTLLLAIGGGVVLLGVGAFAVKRIKAKRAKAKAAK